MCLTWARPHRTISGHLGTHSGNPKIMPRFSVYSTPAILTVFAAGLLTALPAILRYSSHPPATRVSDSVRGRGSDRGARVIAAMRERLCDAGRPATVDPLFVRVDHRVPASPLPANWPNPCVPGGAFSSRVIPAQGQSPGTGPANNGTVIARERLVGADGMAVDVVVYESEGLAIGGLLCYPSDGQRRSAVVHVPGALGGVFSSNEIVQMCIDWARFHDRVAFAPSMRGNDGSEGEPELCQGEASDVAAAVVMVRSLDVVDPERVGLVGGSLGGCIALRASGLVPGLRAVVAYVPPTDWKAVVEFHRTRYQPATELTCEGGTRQWNIGGPALADTFDRLICGRIGCTEAEYNSRSPLESLLHQTAPTMIASAGADNIVPVDQQLLWSGLRQERGYPVDVHSVGSCIKSASPLRRRMFTSTSAMRFTC